ncbi:hypothetical protein AB0H83_29715 [Dactylosporangium sp. NPDC050688]|uniref:hypothetical protein n=1 Tax=Dactylosporangium sp. NPDC050688 TaxID=3157217 RepID=UPI0033DD40E5
MLLLALRGLGLRIVPVDKTLRQLQQAVRSPSEPDPHDRMYLELPADLAGEVRRGLVLNGVAKALLKQAIDEVGRDLRLEHLQDVKSLLHRFVAEASVDRKTDHVAAFMREHARELESADCVLTLLHLEVPERLEIAGTVLLPLGHELVPAVPELTTELNCTAYISVPCRGTNYPNMAERARKQAIHALGLLRAGLEQQNVYHPWQLRFRLGERYAFADRLAGWTRQTDSAYSVAVDGQTAERLATLRFMRVPAVPANDLDRRALLALTWIDRSLVMPDRLVAMLFQFFALEAILGDKAEGRKSLGLAFRRTMLGHVVSGGWPAPEHIYYQYEDVRSAAVHGSEPPVVTDQQARRFGHDVIRTLDEFLAFAETHGYTKRAQVLSALASHEDAPRVLEHLRARDPEWNDFEHRADR